MKTELTNAGITVLNKDDSQESPNMDAVELASYEVDPSVVAVVVGVDPNMTYRKIAIASLYIQLNKAMFIASNTDRNCGVGDRLPPAGGVCVKAVEVATGVKPRVMGKPDPFALQLIQK